MEAILGMLGFVAFVCVILCIDWWRAHHPRKSH